MRSRRISLLVVRGMLSAMITTSLFLLAGCGRPKVPEKPPTEPTRPSSSRVEQKPAPPAAVQPVEYQIVPGEPGDKDVSYGAVKRYVRDITVPYETTDEKIKATLRSALKDFRDLHPGADALTVRVFFEGATAMAHASATWAPGGDWARAAEGGAKSISFESLMPRPPEPIEGEILGLSLAKRQQIFRELVGAEDKAMDEAMAKYPDDFDKQIPIERELTSKYKGQVRQKYGITQDQQKKIEIEGTEQYWEMPSLP